MDPIRFTTMWIAAFQPASFGDCPNITDAGFLLAIAQAWMCDSTRTEGPSGCVDGTEPRSLAFANSPAVSVQSRIDESRRIRLPLATFANWTRLIYPKTVFANSARCSATIRANAETLNGK